MKKLLIYIIAACVAVLTCACSKEGLALDYAAGEGGITMRLANTRAVDVSGLTLDDCTVFIYENRTEADSSQPDAEPEETATLIRKYAPGNCPETIRLLAGSYSVKVQWGERPTAADFNKCFYEGCTDFEVKAGITETVTVLCKPQSVVVDVTFASTIAAALTDYSAEVGLADSDADVKSLIFEESGTGYFTVADGGELIRWTFRAMHAEKGELLKTGEIAAEVGKRYGLTFRYSDDLPGYVSVDLVIDETTDDNNDVFVFSQDPELKGEIFNGPQTFDGKEMSVTMEAVGDATVQTARIYLIDAENESIMWTWPDDAANDSRVKSVFSDDGKILTVTLNPVFFSFPIGETDLRFELVDSFDSKVDKTATIRLNEGIRTVVESDYDLWTNAVTLHGVSTQGVPTFKLRLAGTDEWKTVEGTPVPDAADEYAATFESAWIESQNAAAGVPVYRPDTRWSVLANNRYEVAVEIAGHEYSTTFETSCDQPIPYGDMADGSLSCFTDGHGSFWDSGNNSITKTLCTQATKGGLTCAYLKSGETMGLLSAGNLFTGVFAMAGMNGTVSFGKKYDWKARPAALHVKYAASIGNIDVYKDKNVDEMVDLAKGDRDNSVIYMAVVDWSNPHAVTSGTSTPSGMWSPANLKHFREKGYEAKTGGTIIGYGSVRLSENTQGDGLVDLEIPIYYYDTKTKPSGAYTLVIAASTSYFGDYMVGCSSNELYLTDFRWVY